MPLPMTNAPAVVEPRPAYSRWLPLLLVLVAGLLIAGWSSRLPASRDAAASKTVFSADRAMAHVEAIAVEPHPTGSAAIAATRRYIFAQAQAIGLDVQVQRGTGITELARFPYVAAGSVQNIVATLAGSDRTLPAIVAMAHYDSVALSPGAGDDTAGVATLLETARALKARGPLKRDVIFLFVDGEEAGLLGSSLFFARADRARIGTVMNFEARGTGGRAAMFQVSPASGDLVRLYGASVALPYADSFAASVYKYMPNDTDLTSSLNKGFSGLNFAFAGRQVGYHSPLATPAFLDRGSLQHIGDQSLAMTAALADSTKLPRPAADLVYGDIYGSVLVYYPAVFGWLLVVVAAAALAFGAIKLRRREGIVASQVLRGVALAFALLLVPALFVDAGFHLARLLVRDTGGDYALLSNFSWFLAGTMLLAGAAVATVLALAGRDMRPLWPCLAILGIGLLSAAMAGMAPASLILGALAAVALALVLWRRRASPPMPLDMAHWLGLIGTLWLLTVVAQLVIPTGAHLVGWSMLAAALMFAGIAGHAWHPRTRAIIAIMAALVFAHIATRAFSSFILIGIQLPQLACVDALLASTVLFVLLRDWAGNRHAVWQAAAIGVVGLLCFGVAGGARPPVATMTEAFEVVDITRQQAWRASYLAGLDPWARATLSDGGKPISRQAFAPFLPTPAWTAPTAMVALTPPSIVTDSGSANGQLALVLAPTNGGRSLRIAIRSSTALDGMTLQGVKTTRAFPAGQWSQIAFHAVPAEGLRLAFTAAPAGSIELKTMEMIDGWPVGRSPPAPPIGLLPFRLSNSTIVLAESHVGWANSRWIPAGEAR